MTSKLQQEAADRVEEVLAAFEAGRVNEARTLLAALPLTFPRFMRAIARRVKELAETGDARLADLASGLARHARDSSACSDVVKALRPAAKVLLDRQSWREAAMIFKLILDLEPDQPNVLYRLAKAQIELGERSDAAATLQSLLVASPSHVRGATLLAVNVQSSQMAEIARRIAPLALAHAAAEPGSTADCVQVLARLMCFDEARDLLDRMPSLESPTLAEAAFEIGIDTNDFDLAVRALHNRRWLPEEDATKDTWRLQLALITCDREGLAAPFERLVAGGKLGTAWLLRASGQSLGRYAESFALDWKEASRPQIGERVGNLRPWNEPLEKLSGASVLVIAHTELGDEIRLLELVDRARENFASCTIVVDRRIAGLVARNRPGLTVIGKEKLVPGPVDSPVPDFLRRHLGPEVWAEINRFDRVLMIRDLPSLLVRCEDDLPRQRRTLEADGELRAKWREDLKTLGAGPRIGLFWRSGRVNFRRSAKYTTLQNWRPVLEACRGTFVSLQFGPGIAEEIASVGPDVRIVEIPGLDTRDDIESIAALMCELDLVVTVPGTTMHLAGAVGARTLAVSHPSQILWRARADGRTGTWSPSVEVVSGPPGEGYNGAIRAASSRLQNLTASV